MLTQPQKRFLVSLAGISLAALSLMSCAQQAEERKVLRHVGDIEFDPRIDTAGFEVCHEDLTYQYYNFSNAIQYEGEKAAIIRTFQREFQPVAETENGYVTIRFIVNCHGETGRFRMETMDDNYNPKDLSPGLTDQLFNLTRALDGWISAEYDGRTFDYVQYLTFKITNGDIEDIMP